MPGDFSDSQTPSSPPTVKPYAPKSEPETPERSTATVTSQSATPLARSTGVERQEPDHSQSQAQCQGSINSPSDAQIMHSPARTNTNQLKTSLSANQGSNYSTPLTSPRDAPVAPRRGHSSAMSLHNILSALEKVYF